MGFKFMRYNIVRCDLERVYNFNEYNKTMDYAKKNIEVNGVREQIQKLTAEKNTYIQEMQNIIESEKENEDKKYHEWESWYKKKNICVWITIGLVAVSVINLLVGGFLPHGLHKLFTLLGLLIFIMLPASIVVKLLEFICGNSYYKYAGPVSEKISVLNIAFTEESRKYYKSIDDLYLLSLDPAHREMVLMRRDQAKQHKQIMRIERERIELEKERIRIEKARQADQKAAREEAEQSRKVQERLLQIEEDREIRYKTR